MLDVIRLAIVARSQHLQSDTWLKIMYFLFELHEMSLELCVGRTDMYGAADLINCATETLLVTCVRSGVEDEKVWETLKSRMSSPLAKKFLQTITQWRKILKNLALAYINYTLMVKLETAGNMRGRLRSAAATETARSDRMSFRSHTTRQGSEILSIDNRPSTASATMNATEVLESGDSQESLGKFFSVPSLGRTVTIMYTDTNREKFVQHPPSNRELTLKES
jgi:hypothetical protein